jgi:hypothetical protein
MMKERKNEYKEKRDKEKYVWEKKNIWVYKNKIKWTPRFSKVH